ncbi:MAG: EamA family transporter RarD [Acidiferrobacterales bacterium]
MRRQLRTWTSRHGFDDGTVGVLYGFAAYGMWGLVPIYFKAVQHVASIEVLAHRVIWGMALLAALLFIKRGGRRMIAELRNRRRLAFYCATALLVAINWFVYIWSIHNDRLLEASLGYYINPLVSVLLGVLFLQERLNLWQVGAVILATAGVLNLIIGYGAFPWVALTLAFTFGFYGLLRKKAGMDAILGLSVETLLLTPIALLFLGTLALQGDGAFGRIDFGTDILLVFAGVVTAVPLICFLQAAQRLRLSTVGLMQYLAPTLNFLLAVLVYNEPFTVAHLITFACIWVALAIYSFDAFFARRNTREMRAVSTGE